MSKKIGKKKNRVKHIDEKQNVKKKLVIRVDANSLGVVMIKLENFT